MLTIILLNIYIELKSKRISIWSRRVEVWGTIQTSYAGGIWKQRLHSTLNLTHQMFTVTQYAEDFKSAEISLKKTRAGKSRYCRDLIVFKVLSVHTGTQCRRCQIPMVWGAISKSLLSMWNLGKAAFCNSSRVVWTEPEAVRRQRKKNLWSKGSKATIKISPTCRLHGD